MVVDKGVRVFDYLVGFGKVLWRNLSFRRILLKGRGECIKYLVFVILWVCFVLGRVFSVW